MLIVTPTTASLTIGQTVQLTATGATGAVKWTSSRPAIATVSKNGLVTAVAAGVSVITAKSGKATATSTITVASSVPPISPLPPSAQLTIGSPVFVFGTVQADVRATTDPDGFLVSWSLLFGDGTAAITWTGPDPLSPDILTHFYQLEGTYTATLTVVDNGGNVGVATTQVVVEAEIDPPPANQSPIARLAVISAQIVGQPVTFSTAGTGDPDGVLAEYTFARGDGSSVGPIATPPPATLQHTYNQAGLYTAVLTVEDDGGLVATASVGVNIQPAPIPPQPPANTTLPSISGTAQQGQTLTASTGVWSGDTPQTYTYQWRRCSSGGGNCTNISGQTASTYVLGASDVGATIRVIVTATNGAGSASATSLPSAVIVAIPPDPPPATPPSNVALPTIAGNPQQGQTLTAADGSWTGTAPITLTRVWLRCAIGGSDCVVIAGQTATTYLLTAADVGFTIRVRVTGTNAQGAATAVSAPTATVVTNVPPDPPDPDPLPPLAFLSLQSGVFVGDSFVFSTAGTSAPGSSIANWAINYGDGTGANATGDPPATLSRIYTAAGAKTVTFIVTAANGLQTTRILPITVATIPVPAPAGVNWSSFNATYVLEFFKTAGEEITDPFWFHMHEGHMEAESFTVGLIVWSESNAIPNKRNIPFDQLPAGHTVRYEVRGIPVSDWLSFDEADGHVITLAQIAAAGIITGIHDISLRVQGPQAGAFLPRPSFLHVFRVGQPVEATVPVISRSDQSMTHISNYPQDGAWEGPGIAYVDVTDRVFTPYPVEDSPVAWATKPHLTDLYVEEMQPHTNLFMPMQMWWQEPPGTVSAGLQFVRAIPPKFGGEDARVLYSESANPAIGTDQFGYHGQRSLPFKDGGRGVAWTSPYITGQVDSQGGFAFVEAGGPLRYMRPDGEIITVAGWVTDPAKDPVWMLKPVDLIRQNQVLKGTWSSGQYANNSGFRLPLDVAIDPLNENEWYVVGFYDHCIWKVVTNAARTTATISVFAGALDHSFGHVDGTGTAARFKGPGSLVFCPTADCLYVADQDNDCIRKITRAGVVTTLFGAPNFGQWLANNGGTSVQVEFMYDLQTHNFNVTQNRSLAPHFTATAGQSPSIYLPYTIRVFSNGDICVMDLGFASIRRINPSTGATTLIANTINNWIVNGRYWVWLDVDRWGNSGPLDGVYFCTVVASVVDGSEERRFNEVFAWFPGNGSETMAFYSGPDLDWNPDGWGPIGITDLPHYPWLVAVDPRGGLFMSGIGEHGIVRMRKRRPSDPVPASLPDYGDGKTLWLRLIGRSGGDYSVGFPSPMILFGAEAHNMLGHADAWGLTGATDQQLLTAFQIPPAVQANPTDRAVIVNFIRLNAGPI